MRFEMRALRDTSRIPLHSLVESTCKRQRNGAGSRCGTCLMPANTRHSRLVLVENWSKRARSWPVRRWLCFMFQRFSCRGWGQTGLISGARGREAADRRSATAKVNQIFGRSVHDHESWHNVKKRWKIGKGIFVPSRTFEFFLCF